MHHLEQLKVIEKIGRDWKKVANLLKISSEAVLNIEHDFPNDCERCCQKVLNKWVEGEDYQTITWKTLIEVLWDADRSTLAEELQQFVLQSMSY